MRVRSSTSNPPRVHTNYYTAWSGTPSDPWHVSAYQVNNVTFYPELTTNYMEDVVTPNYRKIVSEGGIINNPMKKTDVRELVSGGGLSMKFVQYSSSTPLFYTGWQSVGSWLGGIMTSNRYKDPPSLDVAGIREIAVTEAFSKNKANDTMLLATIGEFGETVSSLASIFKRAVRIIAAVKRANFRALRKELTPKELAARYMEARYALRPLVYDVKGTLDALLNDRKTQRITARAFASDTGSVQDNVTLYTHTNYTIQGNRSTQRTVEARSGVLSCIENLTKVNIWGLDQIASSAWELVPLSFVVDWFFNVGKTISAWEPTTGLKQLASWVVVKDTTVQTCSVSGCTLLQPTVRIQNREMSYSASATKVTTVVERIPSPNLSVFPRFNVKLDGWKLLDLGIILKNLMR